jgi:hypothetical protein
MTGKDLVMARQWELKRLHIIYGKMCYYIFPINTRLILRHDNTIKIQGGKYEKTGS